MSAAHPRDRAFFSPLLNRIADVAGERAALILGREKACQTVYFPKEPAPDHALARLIGHDAAVALAKEFGGTQIDIPPVLSGQKSGRARAIAEMTDKGYSIGRTASALGVARSTVKDHRRNLRADRDDEQGNLF